MSKKQRPPRATSEEANSPSAWMLVAMAALAAAIIWTIYARVVHAPFIFDDPSAVSENSSIVRLWPLIGDAQHPGSLNPPKDIPTAGRPLVNLSLALNYQFGGFDPLGYHVFNVIVHLLSTLLLMAIVRRTLLLEYFGGRFDSVAQWLALAVALIWAVHPLQTETVVYITQRTELLVGFFYLATLYSSLRYWAAATPRGRNIWLASATAACLAGMASKEMMVTAPVIVLLFERTFITGSFREALRRSWQLYVGLAFGWLLLLALHTTAPRAQTAGFDLGLNATTWWLTQAKVMWMYLKLIVWPWPQSIHYEMPYLGTFGQAWPWLIPAMLLGIATLILLWRRNAVGFVGAWFLLILSPTMVVPIITEVAADRRMYLPLAALVSLLVVGAYWLITKAAPSDAAAKQRRAAAKPFAILIAVPAIIVVAALSVISIHRLAVYHDEFTLWQNVLASQPNDPLAHNNMGVQLGNSGRMQDAKREFENAIALKPDYAQAHFNLGSYFARTGNRADAAVQYRQALASKPNYAEAYNNLGSMLLQTGHPQEAVEQFQSAIKYRPGYVIAYNNLGTTLASIGQPAQAIIWYQQALQFAPNNPETHFNLGSALVGTGRNDEAAQHFKEAVQLGPRSADAHVNYGTSLLRTGHPEEAIDQYHQTLQLNPNSIDAYGNLAVACGQVGRWEEANAAAQKALAIAKSSGQITAAQAIENWLSKHRSDLPQSSEESARGAIASPKP